MDNNKLLYKVELIKNSNVKIRYKAFNNNNELINFINKLNESRDYTEIDDYKINRIDSNNISLNDVIISDTSLQDFIEIVFIMMKK